MQYRDSEDDDLTIYIRLDDILPPLPMPETVAIETPQTPPPPPPPPRRRTVRPRYQMFPTLDGPVEGSPGHSTRQLLNEKAMTMYSDDDSVYLTESNDNDELSFATGHSGQSSKETTKISNVQKWEKERATL